MEIGIIGYPRSGKTTLFTALTGGKGARVGRGRLPVTVGTTSLPDPRLHPLAAVFGPKRITPAEVRYYDFSPDERAPKVSLVGGEALNVLQEVDCLLAVVRAFDHPSIPPPPWGVDPQREVAEVEAELALADLAVAERRAQRLEQALKGAKPHERPLLAEEGGVWEKVLGALREGRPVRDLPLEEGEKRLLASFHLLTAKPLLVVVNVNETDLARAAAIAEALSASPGKRRRVMALCAPLERDLALLEPQEAQAFRRSLGLPPEGVGQVARATIDLLDLVTFFTGNQEEVRAWLVPRGTPAVKAAGRIHSDMERGFIRAEVIPWDRLVASGGMAEARRQGLLRPEGKGYVVQEGDVLHILFSG